MNKNLITKTVAVGIGTALFFVVGLWIKIPTGVPNTSIVLQYGIQSLFAIVFGPFAGFLIGFIGHFLVDSVTYAPWWSWIIASGLFGLIVGYCSKIIKLENGSFKLLDIVKFNVIQVIGNLIVWGGVAPSLDVLIYSEPINKVYLQGLTATIVNAISVGIVGTILLIVYSKTKIKNNSLEEE